MSLINDALKRVKEAQRQTPPSAELGPPLRPVEPAPPPVRKVGLLLPVALVALSLLALALVWVLARRDNSPDALTVRADTAVQQSPTSQSLAPPAERAAQTASHVIPSSGESAKTVAAGGTNASFSLPTNATPTVAAINGSASAHTPTAAFTNGVDANIATSDLPGKSQGTNSPPPIESESKPPPLKLQGIVFSKRPSAVINGRTVFVGDRVREFRILAITPDTAVLAGGGRTNVLSFSE